MLKINLLNQRMKNLFKLAIFSEIESFRSGENTHVFCLIVGWFLDSVKNSRVPFPMRSREFSSLQKNTLLKELFANFKWPSIQRCQYPILKDNKATVNVENTVVFPNLKVFYSNDYSHAYCKQEMRKYFFCWETTNENERFKERNMDK